MRKIAILYICTGQYDVFWKDFFISYEKRFLSKCEKHYYVFTDSKNLYRRDHERVHVVFQKSLGWPNNTLMRYHMFDRIKEDLYQYDQIFFMNANCLCVDDITEEEFCVPHGLLVVQHPGFFDKPRRMFTYDHNPRSTAYISDTEGQFYICGGINGGKAEDYLNAIGIMKDNIDIDINNHVVALWHDESHINRYIIDHSDYTMLSPSYCCPEGWDIPFLPKILVRDKTKWIDVKRAKREKFEFITRILRKLKRLSYEKKAIVNKSIS